MTTVSVDINPTTRMMGLIGESIGYSLSPLIHNGSAKALGIEVSYLCYSMAAIKVASFLDAAWAKGAIGFNITQPHKELVANLVGNSQLMSVNTVYRGPDSWLSASTDGPGLDHALQRANIRILEFERVVLLGSGGAAMGVAEYLQSKGFQGEVIFAVRSQINPVKLSRLAGLRLMLVHQRSPFLSKLLSQTNSTILIQATSAPLKSDRMEWLIPALKNFAGVYFDMTYDAESAPLKFCIQEGLRAFDGIPMLIEQARASQMLWWGRSEDYGTIERRLKSR